MEFGAARRLTPLAPGVWRSLVAHSLWERGAVGSNPATPTPPPRPTNIDIPRPAAASEDRHMGSDLTESHAFPGKAERQVRRAPARGPLARDARTRAEP